MRMVKCQVLLLALTALVGLGHRARGDSWAAPSPEEFASASGKYVFRITPHEKWSEKPGHCTGELFKVEGEKRTLVWSRHLLNDVAPVKAHVTDDGEHVVTLDEWHHVGELPVVIYGPRGRRAAVHTIETLGLGEDTSHIKQSVSSFWWNENSIVFFTADGKRLIIRLHWGKMLIVDLGRGEMMNEKWYELHKGWYIKEDEWTALKESAEKRAGELALELVSSGDDHERQAGAMAAGQLKLRAAIPQLRKLLTDAAVYSEQTGTGPWMDVYPVRKAAVEALKALGENVHGVVTEEPQKRAGAGTVEELLDKAAKGKQ